MTAFEFQKEVQNILGKGVFLRIEECLSCEVLGTSYEDFIIEVDKLDRIESYNFDYIEGCFDTILACIKHNPKNVGYTSSLKYSLSDTPDWWDEAIVDEIPEGATVINVYGTLNY